MAPEDYFGNFYPNPVSSGTKDVQTLVKEIAERLNKIEQPKQPQIVYVPQPIPTPAPQVATQATNTTPSDNKIPWGLIAIVGIVGIVVLGIVAVSTRGK